MLEKEWVGYIAQRLKASFSNKPGLLIETQRKIPYAFEILSYGNDWKPLKTNTLYFETDLLISEARDTITPRIVIEAKISKVTTHDAITYSQKASSHKSVHPYLRYGIMLANRFKYPLPGRLFRHGSFFDFMLNFQGYELTDKELDGFISLIKKELDISKGLEEMIFKSRSTKRKRYWILQKILYTK
jgi:hypothetical protein